MQVDVKQTSLLALTVAAFGFLGYQIYQMVSTDLLQSESTSAYSTSVTYTNSAKAVRPVSVARAERQPDPGTTALHTERPERLEDLQNAHDVGRATVYSESRPVTHEPALFHAPLLKSQQEYLNIVNQYELAKMRRQLLEEQAAIAETKRKILEINTQTQKLQATVISAAGNSATNSVSIPYQLTYLDQQDGQWSATLSNAGRFFEVTVGTSLPGGIVVESVDKNGVVVVDHKKRLRLSFDGLVALHERATPQRIPVSASARETDQATRLQSQLYELKQKLAEQKAKQQAARLAALRKQHEEQALARKLGLDSIELNVKVPELFSASSMLQRPAALTNGEHLSARLVAPEEMDPGLAANVKLILQRPDQHYAIELVASQKEYVVDNFIEAHQLQEDTLKYMTFRRGKPFYVLIYGDYADEANALRALDALPSSIKLESSTIHKYAEIKHAIAVDNTRRMAMAD